MNPAGSAGSLLELWRNGAAEVVVSDATLREAELVLGGGWVAQLSTPAERDELLAELRDLATRVEAPVLPDLTLRDPGDRRLVEAAVAGGAACLATADREVLRQRGYGSVEFLTAHEVLDRLQRR